MFVKTVIRQGKKIIELDKAKKVLEQKNAELEFKNFNTSRENLNLIGTLDDIQEEILRMLDNIEERLTNNDYGRPDIKINNALEYIRYEKEIIEKDLEIDNKKELSANRQTNR